MVSNKVELMALTKAQQAQLINYAIEGLRKGIKQDKLDMAKQEIHWRMGNPISALWWKLMPGTTATVKWPVSHESADPNEMYRPWLEKHVGRQGWDWDWRISNVAADNGQGTIGFDTLDIKFRKGKAKYATIAALNWG